MFIPPGYTPLRTVVRQSSADDVRRQLASGKAQAFRFDSDRGALHHMTANDWLKDVAIRWLEEGKYRGTGAGMWGEEILVKDQDEAPAAQPSPPPEYLSPFVRMMIEATAKFAIAPGKPMPKKHTIEEYFAAQKLPDGTPVSTNQAKSMATFIRPPEAMKGGQKKAG